MAEEWKTGAMIVDKFAIDLFLGVIQAINNPDESGVAMVFLPVETAAAAQTEANSSSNTGSSVYTWEQIHGSGGGGSGGVYPI